MRLAQTFEFSIELNSEDFKRLFEKVYEGDDPYEDNDRFWDSTFVNEGIRVLYLDKQYHSKIKLLADTEVVSGRREPDAPRFIRKMEKLLEHYFEGEFDLADFTLAECSVVADFSVGSQALAEDYLRIIKKIGRVRGFSPIKDELLDGTNHFSLRGNSNGIDFSIFSLRDFAAKLENLNGESNKKAIGSGVLGVQVGLYKKKAIRLYADAIGITEQIEELMRKREKIFYDTFSHIIPPGDFYKKQKAIEIICDSVENAKLRRRMIKLVTMLPKKKSLLLAEKSLNCREHRAVVEMFRKLDLSPITIPKRMDMKHLPSLYSYMN